MPTLRLNRCMALTLIVAARGLAEESRDFKPELQTAELVLGEHTFKPVHVVSPARPSLAAGGVAICRDDSDLVAKKADATDAWRISPPANWHQSVLATDPSCVYLLRWPDPKHAPDGYSGERAVARVALETGKPLESLELFQEPQQPSKDQFEIISVLADKDLVAVLGKRWREEEAKDDLQPQTLRVSLYRQGRSKPEWTRDLESDDRKYGVQMGVSAARNPVGAGCGITPLTRLDEDLLVCATSTAPLMRLSGKDGRTIWEIPRVWEFKRGFVGPSVWQHYMTRCIADGDEGGRKAFYSQNSCWNAAGPAVVHEVIAGHDSYVFFAVGIASKRGWDACLEEYTADCVVFEISGRGEVTARLTMPRFVSGGQFQQVEGSLVWAGPEHTLSRITPIRFSGVTGMGPGGPDCVGQLDWFRAYPEPVRWARLMTGQWSDPFVTSGKTAIRFAGSGYVKDNERALYHFPVRIFDLENGADSLVDLRVRLSQAITEEDMEGKGSHYDFGLPGMEIVGDLLRIFISNDQAQHALEFDWPAIMKATTGQK